jgi:hypothetical protein
MIARNSLALALALALSTAAFAQEKGEKASSESVKNAAENPTFDDLKNSLGDLELKESKEETSKREALVQRNVDETLKIYGDALGKRNGELTNVNRRLDVNKGLESKYERLLATARNGLGTTRAQFINRNVALKKTLDEGKISKEAYEKLLEEDTKRFRNRERELLDDIKFYSEEFQTAQRSGKDLATKKELMQFDPFGENQPAGEKAKAPQPNMVQKLKTTLGEASGYGARSVVDGMR